LIGATGRKLSDPSLTIRKNHMFVMITLIEGNAVKANKIFVSPRHVWTSRCRNTHCYRCSSSLAKSLRYLRRQRVLKLS
jgi:lambda repressor-like predicted transcriptional regulator